MDALDTHIRIRAGDFYIGKVPESVDTQMHKPFRQGLGHRLRHRQNHHVDAVTVNIPIQLVHGENRHVVDLCADDRRGHVEGCVQRKTGLLKMEIVHQGVTEVARADHNQMMMIVHAQDMADFGMQLLHIIAVALLSELPETAQILPYLRCGNIHLLPQRVRGNPDLAPGFQFWELAVVSGQTPDDSVGDIFFFQSVPSLNSKTGSIKQSFSSLA